MSQIAQTTSTVFIGTHVDHETRDALRALARAEDRSISAILRRALRYEFERVNETEEA